MGSIGRNDDFPKKIRPSGNHLYTGVPTIEFDEKREKPWQRVIFEVTRKGTHLYEPVKSVPSAVLLVVLGLYLLLAYLTQLVEDEMPNVIKEVDIARDNSETFSEEAAWRYLRTILGDEPRVSGTKYHLQKTKDLKDLVDSIAVQANIPVRTDWQFVSGDYWLEFSIPHSNVYQNASNIVAVLEGESGWRDGIGTSLLVNCHYDSVPYAMGASDNAIFCAVMMETLSKLSRRSRKLKHNVVFLFNGAEENPLQGSHGFLKHEWSKGITNVINLDACGMNGKPIVFQVSDPRVLKIYKRVVKRPSGQSIGEFMFSTGVIPSDTDFRIWRDFGHFHGIDIAFIKWAHVYHTRYDHPDLVKAGVIQNAGDMMLALVTEAADSDELKDQISPSAAVYYDYLHWFLVTYPYSTAVAVDVLFALFGCLTAAYYVWIVGYRWSTMQELLFAALGRILAMLAAILAVAVCTLVMVAATTQLRYLSHAWLVVPLYWIPYGLTAVCVAHAYDSWRTKQSGLNRCIRTMQAQTATRLLLSLVLLVMCCAPRLVTLRYIVTVPLFIMSLLSLVSMTVIRYVKLQAWQHLLMELLFSLPSTMFMMSISLRFLAIMLPTVGRNGSDKPDYLIAIICVGLCVVVYATLSGIELLFSRKRLWLVLTPVALTCVILMFIPFSPYQDDGPSTQRHYWFHSEIISYDINNVETERHHGLVVTKHDAYTPESVLTALQNRGIRLDSRTISKEDCEQFMYCNLPLFRVRFGTDLVRSLFLYTAGPPAPFVPDTSLRVAARSCAGENCTLSFVMNGTPHNLITLWPRNNVTMLSWSLDSPLLASFAHCARPVYVMVHSTPTYSDVLAPLEFTVVVSVPVSLQSQPIMDAALHSHLIHHPENYTTEYRNILEAMPKYFHINSFLSRRKNYVF